MGKPTYYGWHIRVLRIVGILAEVLGGTSVAGELARDPYDCTRLENDVVGVRVWGPPTQPTLSLGKSDIWDRRWFGDQKPIITLKKLRELAAADRLAEVAPSPNQTIYDDIYSKYDFPCPKPGAQLILATPFATAAQVEPDGYQAIRLVVVGQQKRLMARVWVAAARPLVVMECQAEGLKPEDLSIRVYRHRDTIVPGGPVSLLFGGTPSPKDFEQLPIPQTRKAERMWGVVQDFPAEMTFPDGFRAVVAATVIGAEPTIECRQAEKGLGTPLWAPKEGEIDHGVVKRYTPINNAMGAAATAIFRELPKSFVVLATVATTQDGPDPWRVAAQTVEDAVSLGLVRLRKEQADVLERCTRKYRATAQLEDREVFGAPAIVLPSLRKSDGYYGDVPVCSVGSTKFCFQDAGVWHDDFHLNEIRAERLLTMGQFEEVLSYCHLIHTMLPQTQQNAREVYDLPGAMYPVVQFPLRRRGVAHTNLTWEQDMGLNGMVSRPLWLYYRYTGDKAFLREVAYPVLKECARFMSAYLTEESDGKLHIVPTVSPEHWGLTARFERNRDCTSALTLTCYLLRAAASAAEILGEDHDEAARWKAASERLAPYPTYATPSGPIWVDVAGAPPIEYNIAVPLSPVFWGDDVGLDSPPETLALAKRTLDQIRVWAPHREYLVGIRPRLGICDPGAAMLPENFLVSYQSIHLMPAVPLDAEAAMENLQAEGGFRISARRPKNGEIQDVRIVSLFGEPCRLFNPWPGRRVEVNAPDGKTLTILDATSPYLTFATEASRTYLLKPQHR